MAETVLCPKCESPMRLRQSQRGPFYGCSTYPKCNGTRNVSSSGQAGAGEKKYEPLSLLPGSPEQESIWDAMLHGRYHIVVDAVAGSGKTWTMLQGCLRMPKTANILFVAFNKHIAAEAQGKIHATGFTNVTASTYHSLGYKILRAYYPKAKINEDKVNDILSQVPEIPKLHYQWFSVLALTRKLVALAKNYLLDFESPDFSTEMERVADHHGLDLNDIGITAIAMVPGVLRECLRRLPVDLDFDDMVWAPVWKDLPCPEKYDMLITDESQDLNATQQALAFRACFAGRIVIVGDVRQAIYGFRGAGITSIPDMTKQLQATERGVRCLPLTVTRRCPVAHVAMAQSIVPQIQALTTAPSGVVESWERSKAVGLMQPGDLVICRVNAQLIPTAYDLIARGVKPVVKGRDIGQGLIQLITKLEKNAFDLPALSRALDAYRSKETLKLSALGDKATGRLSALADKCDCLQEFISHSESIVELKGKITSMFSDFEADGAPKQAVILGTVHRTKGLEAHRVFILSPELLPHPMAKKEWEREQEANLAYVAVTRAAFNAEHPGTIVFCGAIPAVYNAPIPIEESEETHAEA